MSDDTVCLASISLVWWSCPHKTPETDYVSHTGYYPSSVWTWTFYHHPDCSCGIKI